MINLYILVLSFLYIQAAILKRTSFSKQGQQKKANIFYSTTANNIKVLLIMQNVFLQSPSFSCYII